MEKKDVLSLWNLSVQDLERKLGLSQSASVWLLSQLREPLNKEYKKIYE